MRYISIFCITLMSLFLASCDVEFEADAGETPIAPGSAVFPLVELQSPTMALNILFVPDSSYGDLSVISNRQAFLDDIEQVIEDGYWQNNSYWVNFFHFNYYYLMDSGSAAAPTGGSICPTVTWPASVDTDGAFADMVLLLHTNTLRDCRWGRKATSEPTSFRTVVHESSHALFNLPDEYCCDGGYRDFPPVLYTSESACNSDAANAGWRDCQSFTASSGDVWWRSEDSITDIMSGSGSTVFESGPADWAVMRDVYQALGSAAEPSIFAPDAWDRP